MNDLQSHWHGLSCLELKVDRPLGPTLFRQLGDAARRLRESGIADGAISSYGSIAAYWNRPPTQQQITKQISDVVQQCLKTPDHELVRRSQTYHIDVRYDGPDLDELATSCALTAQDVIDRHTKVQYTVAAVGFMPHFAYLWGLDPLIAAARKSSPRVRVPIGSLGIAGQQTGIYPQESPGGWQLIGKVSPDVCTEICPHLKIGDVVRFREIHG